ncbi:hypothetical protein VTN31DRAFT_3929 [Thermomyces dupontii]|uniref:uncharacterized protein n=1 Tax=Talaromyces thermophilus TaxID=28565 RepID=UPI0037443773
MIKRVILLPITLPTGSGSVWVRGGDRFVAGRGVRKAASLGRACEANERGEVVIRSSELRRGRHGDASWRGIGQEQDTNFRTREVERPRVVDPPDQLTPFGTPAPPGIVLQCNIDRVDPSQALRGPST